MTSAVLPGTRFDAAFANRRDAPLPGLIPYLTAGFPRRDETPQLLKAAQDAGAMALEVGIPFSDPLADGPTIQRAGWRALQNGMTLKLAIEQVAEARMRGVTVPVALMTYLNPVLAYGISAAARDAREADVDGFILPDVPAGEADEIRDVLRTNGIALIPLVAPTTPEPRVARIVSGATGFVYCVSVTGVTGMRDAVPGEAITLLETVRRHTDLPRALGFGLSRHEHINALQGHAEAAVVGSALIDAVEAEQEDAAGAVQRFCAALLGARD
jgi:tryptophan synthase alpha chain